MKKKFLIPKALFLVYLKNDKFIFIIQYFNVYIFYIFIFIEYNSEIPTIKLLYTINKFISY
jgi:hypothetical protein